MSVLDAGAALPRRRPDILPALTPLAVALVAAPFIGSPSTFVTLTAAGLAMGMMIFTMASGLTLVFGMMDVLNFGHGAFIALGAYAATLVLLPLASWSSADSLPLNLAAFVLAVVVAALVCGVFGWVFERLIVKPVYGQHLKQILATIGGSIVAEQLLYAVFGPAQIPLNVPKTFEGSFVIGQAAIEKYRLVATCVGLLVFAAEMLILNRTKIGLLIRAGVENREMVEALGYRVDRLFVAVFMAGSALAGLGGAMMALYRGQVHATIGGEFLVLCFIVIIIGGLGSVGGSFVASILVALIANYAGFLAPKLALVSNILAMVAVLHERRAHASRRAHPYRPLSHPAGRGPGRAGGPDDHAARPQRRRQDDHAPHHHGPVAGLEGTDRARRDAAREHGRERCRAAWRRLCAGDDGGVLRSHGQGEPGARRARPPARRRASRLDLRLLSGAEEILARRAPGRCRAGRSRCCRSPARSSSRANSS